MDSSATLYQRGVDAIFRVSENSESESIRADFVMDTSTFLHGLSAVSVEVRVLRNAVTNLWKNHLYGEEYTSYLLGALPQEEFMAVAAEYAEPMDDEIDDHYLLQASRILFDLLDQPLTSSELSVLLNTDSSTINHRMSLLGYQPYGSEDD